MPPTGTDTACRCQPLSANKKTPCSLCRGSARSTAVWKFQRSGRWQRARRDRSSRSRRRTSGNRKLQSAERRYRFGSASAIRCALPDRSSKRAHVAAAGQECHAFYLSRISPAYPGLTELGKRAQARASEIPAEAQPQSEDGARCDKRGPSDLRASGGWFQGRSGTRPCGQKIICEISGPCTLILAPLRGGLRGEGAAIQPQLCRERLHCFYA